MEDFIMICKNCGATNADTDAFCVSCGAALEEAAAQVVTEEVAAEVVSEETVENGKNPGKTLGIVSLVLGIASLLIGSVCSCTCACLGGSLPLLMAIGGIVTGAIGLSKAKKAGEKNPLALVGMILSIVAIVIIIIFIIVNAVIGGASGLLQTGNMY